MKKYGFTFTALIFHAAVKKLYTTVVRRALLLVLFCFSLIVKINIIPNQILVFNLQLQTFKALENLCVSGYQCTCFGFTIICLPFR